MTPATVKKILGSLMAVLAGGIFIFSGATKLMPVEAFEISLVDIGFSSFALAPYMARLIIGLEFTLGFLLIFHFRLRKVTIPLAAGLLVIFTIYILYLLKTYGNRGSCGCFGTVVEITPLEGLVKNFALFAILGVAYFWASPFEFPYKWLAAIFGAVILLVLPFLINQVGFPFQKQPMSGFKHFAIDTAVLYKDIPHTNSFTDITAGKHIVAFMSPTCPHCRLAAKKLLVYKKQEPGFPLIFVLFNSKKNLPVFFDDTKSDSIPHILMNNREGFLQLTQGVFPRLFWVNRDTVEYETNYYELDRSEIDKWLRAKN